MAELVDYDELSDAALEEKVRELRATNDALRAENGLLDSYLGRQGVSGESACLPRVTRGRVLELG